MSQNSPIEWTDVTWNPTTGCTKVSPGCKHCYAETMYERFHGKGSFKTVICHEDRLTQPFKWKKPSMCFVDSMSDLFHEDIPFEFIDKVFIVMAMNPEHTFQILTKRLERATEYFKTRQTDDQWWDEIRHKVDQFACELGPKYGGEMPAGWLWDVTYSEDGNDCDLIYEGPWPLKNVWIGASAENQKYLEERFLLLTELPAEKIFLSCEPLLGPLELPTDCTQYPMVDWVIVGGESGAGARPMHPKWVRSLRNQCKDQGIAFFFKQWGAFAPWLDVGDLYPNRNPIVLNYYGMKMTGYKKGDGAKFSPHCMADIVQMVRVGKKKSGNLLDGRKYQEFPIKKEAV